MPSDQTLGFISTRKANLVFLGIRFISLRFTSMGRRFPFLYRDHNNMAFECRTK